MVNTIFCPVSYHYVDGEGNIGILSQNTTPGTQLGVLDNLKRSDYIQLLIAKDNATRFMISDGNVRILPSDEM